MCSRRRPEGGGLILAAAIRARCESGTSSSNSCSSEAAYSTSKPPNIYGTDGLNNMTNLPEDQKNQDQLRNAHASMTDDIGSGNEPPSPNRGSSPVCGGQNCRAFSGGSGSGVGIRNVQNGGGTIVGIGIGGGGADISPHSGLLAAKQDDANTEGEDDDAFHSGSAAPPYINDNVHRRSTPERNKPGSLNDNGSGSGVSTRDGIGDSDDENGAENEEELLSEGSDPEEPSSDGEIKRKSNSGKSSGKGTKPKSAAVGRESQFGTIDPDSTESKRGGSSFPHQTRSGAVNPDITCNGDAEQIKPSGIPDAHGKTKTDNVKPDKGKRSGKRSSSGNEQPGADSERAGDSDLEKSPSIDKDHITDDKESGDVNTSTEDKPGSALSPEMKKKKRGGCQKKG